MTPPHIITSAIDGETPILWKDMTPEQKGALLLAEHDGGEVQVFVVGIWVTITTDRSVQFLPHMAYRARPAPKVTERTYGWSADWGMTLGGISSRDTHKITMRFIGDGFGTYTGPDGATITVEKAE